MNEQRARCSLEEKYSVPGAEKEYDARHEAYVMEMPPPGERIRGREKMRAFQESFPDHSNLPTIRVRGLLVTAVLAKDEPLRRRLQVSGFRSFC